MGTLQKRAKLCGRVGKKRETFGVWAPHPCGPHPSEPPPLPFKDPQTPLRPPSPLLSQGIPGGTSPGTPTPPGPPLPGDAPQERGGGQKGRGLRRGSRRGSRVEEGEGGEGRGRRGRSERRRGGKGALRRGGFAQLGISLPPPFAKGRGPHLFMGSSPAASCMRYARQ